MQLSIVYICTGYAVAWVWVFVRYHGIVKRDERSKCVFRMCEMYVWMVVCAVIDENKRVRWRGWWGRVWNEVKPSPWYIVVSSTASLDIAMQCKIAKAPLSNCRLNDHSHGFGPFWNCVKPKALMQFKFKKFNQSTVIMDFKWSHPFIFNYEHWINIWMGNIEFVMRLSGFCVHQPKMLEFKQFPIENSFRHSFHLIQPVGLSILNWNYYKDMNYLDE